MLAIWYALRRPSQSLGLNKQVPRSWAHTMPVGIRFLLWGVLLGSGMATVIPHSIFIVVLAIQLSSGPAFAALTGLIFGLIRGLCSVFLLVLGKEVTTQP